VGLRQDEGCWTRPFERQRPRLSPATRTSRDTDDSCDSHICSRLFLCKCIVLPNIYLQVYDTSSWQMRSVERTEPLNSGHSTSKRNQILTKNQIFWCHSIPSSIPPADETIYQSKEEHTMKSVLILSCCLVETSGLLAFLGVSARLPRPAHPLYEALDAAAYEFVTEIEARINKPMGIIIEEIDDTGLGVRIAQINPDGATAMLCRSGSANVCLRDKILAVNAVPCGVLSFEEVMDMITSTPGGEVSLLLGRPEGTIPVQWPNGVSVAAWPGEYLGNLAGLAGFQISYSCRSGSCGSCEHSIETDNSGETRHVRPCVARVPKDVACVAMHPTGRLDS
jgi:ferredoxin